MAALADSVGAGATGVDVEAAGRRRQEAREVTAEDDAAAIFFLDARGAGDAAAVDLLDIAREDALGREAHRVDADLRSEY